MSEGRACSKCGISKPLDEFQSAGARGTRRDGKKSHCKECCREYKRARAGLRAEVSQSLDWRTMMPVTSGATQEPTSKRSRYWSPEERLWQQTEPGADGCIVWTGARVLGGGTREPYGRIGVGTRVLLAHRYAYGLANGAIPAGLQIHHTCHNTLCVNPEHLEPLTAAAHGRFHPGAAKTHCKRGHPFDEVNTIWRKGQRRCQVCITDHSRRWNRARFNRSPPLKGREFIPG